METKTMLVTPEFAKEMLSKNIKNNRKPNLANIKRYAAIMKKGLWVSPHPQPIIMSYDGELLDGQHRFYAVLMSGVTIKCNVVFADKSVMYTVDDGKKRSPSDACSIAGIPNSVTYASIMRYYTVSKELNIFTSKPSGGYSHVANTELIDMYYENPEKYDKICSLAEYYYKKGRLLKKSTIGGLIMLLNEVNSEYASPFIEQLFTGIDIKNNSIYLLRQRLISEISSTKKTPSQIIHALIIKVWNAVIEGKEYKTLSFNPVTEKYPNIFK